MTARGVTKRANGRGDGLSQVERTVPPSMMSTLHCPSEGISTAAVREEAEDSEAVTSPYEAGAPDAVVAAMTKEEASAVARLPKVSRALRARGRGGKFYVDLGAKRSTVMCRDETCQRMEGSATERAR